MSFWNIFETQIPHAHTHSKEDERSFNERKTAQKLNSLARDTYTVSTCKCCRMIAIKRFSVCEAILSGEFMDYGYTDGRIRKKPLMKKKKKPIQFLLFCVEK